MQPQMHTPSLQPPRVSSAAPACTGCGLPEAPHRFAGCPVCGLPCAEAALRGAISAELAASTAAALEATPRVRIGEILVGQGVITEAQLERALRSQKLTGAGRLGTWLRQQTQLPEHEFSAALSIQWGCPVFRIGLFSPAAMTHFLPRTLVEATNALPLRVSRDPERLTICFEDRVDRELLGACERMHRVAVEGGLLPSNEFWHGSGEILRSGFSPAVSVAADSLDEMVAAMGESVLAAGVADARLVHLRGYYWLRLWTENGGERAVRDVVCTLRLTAEGHPAGTLGEEIAGILGLERAG